MSRGRRYDDAQRLNFKKVITVLLILAAIVLFVFGINKLLHIEKNTEDYFSEITYYSMYQNEKWGVINSKGETVIEPEYSEMIVIPDNKKAVFICTYDVNYSDGTYKTKAINSNNSQLFSDYATIEALGNYDGNGNIWNEDNVLKVSKDVDFLFTVEEHSVIGGLGEAVSSFLSEVAPRQVSKIGIKDRFGESGKAEELLKKHGLDEFGIYKRVKEVVFSKASSLNFL